MDDALPYHTPMTFRPLIVWSPKDVWRVNTFNDKSDVKFKLTRERLCDVNIDNSLTTSASVSRLVNYVVVLCQSVSLPLQLLGYYPN